MQASINARLHTSSMHMRHRTVGPRMLGLARLLLAFVTLPFVTLPMHARDLPALDLHATRASPTDLEVSGLLRGVPASEHRFVRWQDIRQLPSRTITTDGEFMQGTQAVRIVLLEDLLARLPIAPGFDTVIAECSDGYAAVYTAAFRQAWKPFVIVEINDAGPSAWPLPGMPTDPGPYIVSVSDAVTPGVGKLLDVAHKQPWGTVALRVVREADAFSSFNTGAWRTLSAAGARGRDLWMNACFSCHTGPGDGIGGTRSGRPFAVLQALAQHSPGYFESYVRNPRALRPEALMTPHAHYTAEQMADLIAFVVAEPAPAP